MSFVLDETHYTSTRTDLRGDSGEENDAADGTVTSQLCNPWAMVGRRAIYIDFDQVVAVTK